MARIRQTVSGSTGTSENSIVFFPAGGHSHDGNNSSLINTTAYSIYDFSPSFVGTDINRDRSIRQESNRIAFEDLIKRVVNSSVLEPAGIRLNPGTFNGNVINANTITANEIASNTVTADNLVSNIVLINNVIRSSNYAAGSAGWIISNTGSAEFNQVTVRGTIAATSGNIAGWTINTSNITGGSTSLYSNGTISGAAISGGTVTGAAIYSGAFYTQGNANTNIGVQIYNSGLVCYKLNGVLNLFVDNSNTGGVTIGSLTVNYGTSLVGNVSAPGGFVANSNGVYGYLFSGTVGVYAPYIEATTRLRVNESGGAANNPFTYMETYQAKSQIVRSYNNSASVVLSHDGSLLTVKGTLNCDSMSFYNTPVAWDAIFDSNFKLAYTSGYSSIRFKNSITEDLDEFDPTKLLDLKFVKFKYNEGIFENQQDVYTYGFLAEQVAEIWPYSVCFDEENRPFTIDTKTLITPTIALVQVLSKRIDQLESRIKILEGV